MAGLIVFNDVILPDCIIAAGLAGKRTRLNERAQNQAGFDSVNVVRQMTLRQFEVVFKPMASAAWNLLTGIYEVTDAGAYGFLMEDPSDSLIPVGAGLLQPMQGGFPVGALGVGYGVPTYQLYKRYAIAGTARTKDRKITRLQLNPIFKRGTATLVAGVAAGNISIDRDTGLVTFVPDASQSIASITVGASTVINFANGAGIVAAMSVGQRLFLNGVLGTAGTSLNGKSHVVSAKGATSLTFSVATTGLVATSATGTAYKYPQATEALTASGKFYLPVHFANDDLDFEFIKGGANEADRLIAGPSCTLIEIRE